MKILWLTMDFHRYKRGAFRHYYLSLEESLEKIAEVVFYGRKEKESDVEKIVKEIRPDMVMVYCDREKWRNLDKVRIPKAVRCSDPWRNILRQVKWIKKNKIDLVFLLHGAATPEYQKRVKAKCVGLFQSLSSKLFKNLNLERIYDVFLTGNLSSNPYPLRHAIYNAYRHNPNCWVRRGFRSLPTLEKYIRKLNQSNILASGNCRLPLLGRKDLRFFQVKPLEAMATGALAMMDVPTCAKELHLVPDYNFVAIDQRNFKEKIKYYLQNEEDRTPIIKRVYETFIKYHSSDVRARQVKRELNL